MRSIGAPLFCVIRRGIVPGIVGSRAGVKLVEDTFDSILAGDRVVVDEPEFGRPFQPESRADLTTQERGGPAERAGARFERLVVTEHGVEDACDLQVGTDLDPRQRDEPDARIVHVTGQHRGELASNLICHAIWARTLRHVVGEPTASVCDWPYYEAATRSIVKTSM